MAAGCVPIPDWFSTAAEGMGVAVTDLDGAGSPDLLVLATDSAAALRERGWAGDPELVAVPLDAVFGTGGQRG